MQSTNPVMSIVHFSNDKFNGMCVSHMDGVLNLWIGKLTYTCQALQYT